MGYREVSTDDLRRQYVDGSRYFLRMISSSTGSNSYLATKFAPSVVEMSNELDRRGVGFVHVDKDVLLSSFTGLFWFDAWYKSVDDVVGVREFHRSDVFARKDVFPVGFHQDYMPGDRRPRGRVSVVHGNVVVNVGLKCPDGVIGDVVEVMGLGEYADILHVNRGYHWNAK